MITPPQINIFKDTQVPHYILVLGIFLSLFYLYIIAFWFEPGNLYLFAALMIGQLFSVWQVMTYIFTVWNTSKTFPKTASYTPHVDVYVTVAGEPIEIVEETARRAIAMKYPNFSVYLLNDGFVAKKENWQEIESLAERLGVSCITRKVAGGAKAGNINNALKQTNGEIVCVFDADHVPYPNFLEETIPYFIDSKLAFVQTPQYYKNKLENRVTHGAWDQQELFFGPICKGKNNYNAATMCGTNMAVRREALEGVGGMCEESIAEDFVTGLFMHAKGWKSIYLPTVLAEGLAPEDFQSYFKQQLRWAQGSLDIIFHYRVLTRVGLTLAQRIQYLASASHFLSGVIILMNALFPIVFLLTGKQPFVITTMELAAVFLPYIFVTLYIIRRSSGNTFTFRSLAFSMSGFSIHLLAIFKVLSKKKATFAITPKRALSGNFTHLVLPHISYFVLFLAALGIAMAREGLTPAVVNNMAWALINCSVFLPFILAALPEQSLFRRNPFTMRGRIIPVEMIANSK